MHRTSLLPLSNKTLKTKEREFDDVMMYRGIVGVVFFIVKESPLQIEIYVRWVRQKFWLKESIKDFLTLCSVTFADFLLHSLYCLVLSYHRWEVSKLLPWVRFNPAARINIVIDSCCFCKLWICCLVYVSLNFLKCTFPILCCNGAVLQLWLGCARETTWFIRNLCFGWNLKCPDVSLKTALHAAREGYKSIDTFFSPQHCPDVSLKIPGVVSKRTAWKCPDVSLKMVGVVAKHMPDKCPDISSTISCFMPTKMAWKCSDISSTQLPTSC